VKAVSIQDEVSQLRREAEALRVWAVTLPAESRSHSLAAAQRLAEAASRLEAKLRSLENAEAKAKLGQSN